MVSNSSVLLHLASLEFEFARLLVPGLTCTISVTSSIKGIAYSKVESKKPYMMDLSNLTNQSKQ